MSGAGHWRVLTLRRTLFRILHGSCFGLLCACGAGGNYVWVHQLPPAALDGGPALLAPGDRIFLLVANQPTLTGEHVVGEDGSVPFPLVGRVVVAGTKPDVLARRLGERLRAMLERPEVSVTVLARRAVTIDVLGEVRQPGSYEVRAGTGVTGALSRAGGITEFAHRRHVYVVRRGPSPLRVRFGFRDLTRGDPTSARFVLIDGDLVVVE